MVIILLLFLILPLFNIVTSIQMRISYCDGPTLVHLNHSNCLGGVNFGARRPACICINGIYRLWMDNCVVYDGFMSDGCATLSQGEYSVVGLRLTTGDVTGTHNYPPDDDDEEGDWSNATAAVFAERDAADYESWNAYGRGSKTSTSADNFYTLHGDAFIFTGGTTTPTVCVQRRDDKKKQRVDEICRYFREDNSQLWNVGVVQIIVDEEKCSPPFGARKIPLVPSSCYNIMRQQDSECSLSCVPPPDVDNDQEDNRTPVRRSSSPSGLEADGGNDVDDNDGHLLPEVRGNSIQQQVINSSDGVRPGDVTARQQTEATNYFLNRKLNHYSKLRQVGYLKPHDLRQIPPKRTFELLDLVREIGKRACPEEFVSSIFIDQALDLFVLLHKGRNYRYIEDLGASDAGWIRTILGGCLLDARPLLMVQDVSSSSSPQCTDLQRINGVCRGVSGGDGEGNCSLLEVSRNHEGPLGSFHLVVEAAWDLVDLAQVICFPAFAQSYRMLHQWEQASEKLFTREIRKLWHNPGLSMKAYQSLLTPSAAVDAHNLELCVEGAYSLNPILTRLSRPPEPRRFFRRRKRDITSSPPSSSTSSSKSKTGEMKKEIVEDKVYCRPTDFEFEYPC